MASVSIHAPKTPVTEGSMTIAKATLPNICKMPGPPAPFVPTPLPNIAKSGMSPDGYSKDVKIEGNAVAIFGASFQSMGDVASKGTGGGLISANTGGPVKFISPGSLTVKIEGKAVHLLGEPVLNNLGPGGAPPNTGATMGGCDHKSGEKGEPPNLECGECGTYAELKEKAAKPVDMERDHIPSKASLFARARKLAKPMSKKLFDSCVKPKIEARGMAVAIPRSAHRGFSPTCGSKNTKAQIAKDSTPAGREKAVDRDTRKMQKHINEAHPECKEAYKKAAKKIKEHDNDKMIKNAIKECKA
jgi:hypothetical protein